MADIVIPAPSKPPIMLPSLQLLSSTFGFGAGAIGWETDGGAMVETLGDG